LNVRAIRALGLALSLGCGVCLFASPASALPHAGKISGVVVDPAGTPQMGATVVVSAESLLSGTPIQLLTNDRGRFTTVSLPAGLYSLKVTLAGFMPAMEQNIKVDEQHATLLQIVLGSVLSSFEQLRRQPNEPVAADDWTWVLRSSAATRTVLRWQDGQLPIDTSSPQDPIDASSGQTSRERVDLTSGSDHPGSVSGAADSPATAFVYDAGLGASGHLLMAGQFSYEDASSSGGLAGEWLPSGESGAGPVTTVVVRETRVAPYGLTFRGLRLSHEDELALGSRVSLRYGGEFLMAGFGTATSALRPHAEVAVQIAQGWQASIVAATAPWHDSIGSEGAMQSALDALDSFPTLMMRDGHPVLENGVHEELAVKHILDSRSDISAAVFHDRSTHTAVIGIGNGDSIGSDFIQDSFSPAFAYDGGAENSTGARLAYNRRITDSLTTTVVYAYGGALAPEGDSDAAHLRDELATRYRQSVGGRVSMNVPYLRTKVSMGYKWLSGTAVSHQDAYGESLYQLDPYWSMQLRQPLPTVFSCHMEVQADVGNLLAQGYVPVSTGDGSLVLVPSYRFFRGGLSLQF
jgi:Carboxypeptidase regulatory-like domain